MGATRTRRHVRAAMTTVALATAMVGLAPVPAHAATAVAASAYGYSSRVSLFGGPYDVRGYGQASNAPAIATTPSVSLSPYGGGVSVTDADGSTAAYGPAVIFGWYDAATGTYGSTGSQTAYAAGSIGGSGAAMSRATVNNAGPGPLVMPQIVTTCSQSGSSVQVSVQITNGYVETSTDPSTGAVTSIQAIPANPAPGTRINGTINHVGDSFHVIFNEQRLNANGSTSVVGAHMYLTGPTAVGDLVVASATCGVTP